MPSKIEWTDETWNPVTGCTKVSAGCANCYAERMSKRFGWPWEVTLHPDRLDKPLHWRKPRRVFVCSMGDLFHEDVPDLFIAKVFDVMAAYPHHTFQVLTKRAERMSRWPIPMEPRILPNVWLGVSAENQEAADERIPLLLQTPAAVRFVSVEPMLGPVDLWGAKYPAPGGGLQGAVTNWPGGLDWVICGCESGPGARPMHPDWPRSLRDQCAAAGVPLFLKQMSVNGKIVKMPALDGVVHDALPQRGRCEDI